MAKLAINGGVPVRTKPFPPRIMFNEEEKKAVAKLMEKASHEDTASALDRYADEETEVDLYEKEFATYFKVKYAAAVSSGTAAIHSALGALKLEPGDEIITSPITDPGTIAPILFQNCIPVFADIDYETLNIKSNAHLYIKLQTSNHVTLKEGSKNSEVRGVRNFKTGVYLCK